MTDTSFFDGQYRQLLGVDLTDRAKAVAAIQAITAYTAAESGYTDHATLPSALIHLADAAQRAGHPEIAEMLIGFAGEPHGGTK